VKRLIGSIASWVGRSYPGRLIGAFGSSQAGNYASGLAFNAFLSMFPLILGLLALLGFATQSSTTSDHVRSAIVGFFPTDASTGLKGAFEDIKQHPGLLGIVGIVGLLWSGGSLFTSMEFSLGMVIGTRQRPFLRQRGMALVMTILFVVAMVTTVGVSVLIALPGVGWLIEPIVGLIVWYAFMLAIYRLVPNRTYRVRNMWPGILIAGTAMEALTLLWPLYARLAHSVSTYGSVVGLFFVLASWLYFLAEFILLGAVANRMHCGDPETRGLLAARDRGRAPVARGSQAGGEVS
jgi:membrane protein